MKKISKLIVSRAARLCLAPAILGVLFSVGIAPSLVQAAPPKNQFLFATNLSIGALNCVPEGIVVSPDSKVVYVAARGPGSPSASAFFVINATFGNVISKSFITGQLNAEGIAINPAGTVVYIINEGDTGSSGSISVLQTSNNTIVNTVFFPQAGPFPTGAAVSPDGKQLWVANSGTPPNNNNGSVFIYDISVNPEFPALLAQAPIGNSVTEVAFSANAKTVFALNSIFPGFITRINPTTFVPGPPLALGTIVPTEFGLAIDPKTATQIFVANVLSTVSALTPGGKQIKAINMFPTTVPTGFQGLGQPVVSPDGTLLYVAQPFEFGFGGGTIGWVKVGTPAPQKFAPILTGGTPETLAFAPNGTMLYVGDQFVLSPRIDFILIH